jgi:hypothetical protein
MGKTLKKDIADSPGALSAAAGAHNAQIIFKNIFETIFLKLIFRCYIDCATSFN